ncbi:hypothetical protein [Bacillus sp. FJAT-50079]|uniref:lectin-like domain-containing protein n=1 Tax=Bacillus sp. FJAT-50079 TaxID=2833577 RepID=UPI001BCA5AD0|nr:hypothetical protein [Bacillus sp. FJAT-50079]MBS4207057.1 hypothetical protein [Bacillus sp. FJAT-50079]
MGLGPKCIIFDDFTDVSDLTLNGTAMTTTANGRNVLRLTSAGINQDGSAFTSDALPVSRGFCTSFAFQMTDAGGFGDDDGPGADGIVFIVQSSSNTALGEGGGGIGYLGIPKSAGVEFDTFFNDEENIDDPNGNHVGVDLNGSVKSVVVSLIADRLNNGNVWFAWVDYSPKTQLLEVRLSTTSFRPVKPTVTYKVDLQAVIGSKNAYVGFSASTGLGYENQDILFWEFCTPRCP